MLAASLLERAEQEPDAAKQLTDEQGKALVEAIERLIATDLPKLQRLAGSGVQRYEGRLQREGLGAPPDRQIPADLDQALAELGALRDVLTHRSGRVDAKALAQVPTLRYGDGDLVRISGEEYRTYSAAVRCYAHEVTFRSIRSWPEVTDEEDGPDLASWQQYVYLAA